MTGHFYCEKFHWTRKSTVGLAKNLLMSPRMTGHFVKEPSDLEEKAGTFIVVKSSVGLAKNLLMSPRKSAKNL